MEARFDFAVYGTRFAAHVCFEGSYEPLKFPNTAVASASGTIAPQKRLDVGNYACALLFPVHTQASLLAQCRKRHFCALSSKILSGSYVYRREDDFRLGFRS